MAHASVACGGKISPAPVVLDTGPDFVDTGVCALVDAGPLDPTVVQRGSDLVVALKCRTCHAGALSGNAVGIKAPADDGGLAFPPNLTPDPATGLGCWTQDQIVEALQRGVDNAGQYICPPMPRFAVFDGGITDDEARAIATYLQSLAPASSPNVPSTYCTMPSPDEGDAGPDATVAVGH
ncbi:MAG: c-type cytochrome [Polyangiales bacterium]